MDAKEFRRHGKEMIDYVTGYLETIRNRQAYPDVEPGYMRPLLPAEAPTVPDKWEDVIKDIERVIMPGLAHWQSPQFHAYVTMANSYPAICADILSEALGSQGFSWATSPACTELEVVMLDWLGKMLNLPPEFLACSGGEGGGVIQHWQIPLTRRFRSLKLWFVLRLYGQLGLQEYIRNHVRLAHIFEEYVKADHRFEIIGKVILGLVCFRLKGSNDVNEKLLRMINDDRRIHMISASLHGTHFLRFSICSANTTADDVTFAWNTIQEVAERLLKMEPNGYLCH